MYKITAVRLKTGNNTYSEEMPIEVSVENVVWDQNTTLTDYLDTVVQNFAEEYSNASTYAVGDYCIYEGQLYKCNTAISVAEDFDLTKWDTINLADEVSGIDPSNKMDKVNPVGSGSLSINRKANTTIGLYSTAEGYNNENAARSAHAEGEGNVINSTAWYAHVEGNGNTANGYYNHIEGYQNTAASGTYGAHVEGLNNESLGYCQHVEGTNNEAGTSASYAHVEGNGCIGSGTMSHAEGQTTTASGRISHAEGSSTTASADYAHAQGYSTTASASSAHAQGSTNVASGSAAHAQGTNTTASGDYSHAEGFHTTASDSGTHAEGYYTLASSEYQHVFGKYNIEDTYDTYVEIVGNGAKSGGTVTRANARTLDWHGNETLAGNLTITGSVTYDNGINLGTQISGLNTRITKAVTNAAANYSNASTYAVNDVVTYNDQLYICTTAVTIPEDFDSSKWQTTTVFQYVGNGKSLIAGAITDKGVQTSATDSFATMATNIRNIPSGGSTGALIVPDYCGLSYAVLNYGGSFAAMSSNNGCMNYFKVKANTKYVVYLEDTTATRYMIQFYSGLYYDTDFSQWTSTPGSGNKYTSTQNITGNNDGNKNYRFIYTPATDGTLIVRTSNNTTVIPAYCFDTSIVAGAPDGNNISY